MIFDKISIIKAIADGRIVFNASPKELEELIGPNSIDFRFGKRLYELEDYWETDSSFLNPYRVNSEERKSLSFFHGAPQRHAFFSEKKVHTITREYEVEILGIPEEYIGYEYFMLEPNKCYIGESYEEFGTNASSGIVPEVRAKSTTGRNMLTVALCAGMGDEGYCGKWALEIRTVGCYVPLIIGTPIGQVVFHQTVSGAGTGIDYKLKAGAYQKAGEAAKLIPKPMKVVR